MTFRFAAKHGLLTYPQCEGLDPWRIVEMLAGHGAECIIGRESHRDGGLHYHAFFLFERKFESRNVRIFDVDGFHPNVVRGYSQPEKGCAYAIKEGDVVAGGLDPGQFEAMFLGLAVHGLKYAYQVLERNFLKLARFWLQGHFCAPLPRSSATRTGSIDPSPCRTQLLVDYRLIQARTQSSMLGYHTIWRDINLVSQCCSAAPC